MYGHSARRRGFRSRDELSPYSVPPKSWRAPPPQTLLGAILQRGTCRLQIGSSPWRNMAYIRSPGLHLQLSSEVESLTRGPKYARACVGADNPGPVGGHVCLLHLCEAGVDPAERLLRRQGGRRLPADRASLHAGRPRASDHQAGSAARVRPERERARVAATMRRGPGVSTRTAPPATGTSCSARSCVSRPTAPFPLITRTTRIRTANGVT
jgi:hypothetical protein